MRKFAKAGPYATLAAALVLAIAAGRSTRAATYAHADDKKPGSEFLKKSAQGSLAEIDLGNLAQSQSGNADVKGFGQKMVTEHTAALEKIKTLAASKGIELPTKINDENQAKHDELAKLTKGDFNHKYMDMMIDDHKMDIDEAEKASKDNPDAETRALAADLLSTYKTHLDHAKEVRSKLKK